MYIATPRISTKHILTDKLRKYKVYAWQVPGDLSKENQNYHTVVVIDFLTWYAAEKILLLDHIVTGDNTWVCHYTPPIKLHTMMYKGKVYCLLENWSCLSPRTWKVSSSRNIYFQVWLLQPMCLQKAINWKEPGFLSQRVVLCMTMHMPILEGGSNMVFTEDAQLGCFWLHNVFTQSGAILKIVLGG